MDSKTAEYDSIRKAWKKFIRLWGVPSVHLLRLHGRPSDYQSEHPAMFSDAFDGDASPVPAQVNMTMVSALQHSFGTRGIGRSASSSSNVPMLQLGAPDQVQDAVAMIARQLMDHQTRMFGMLMQGGAPEAAPPQQGQLQNMFVQRSGSRLFDLPPSLPPSLMRLRATLPAVLRVPPAQKA